MDRPARRTTLKRTAPIFGLGGAGVIVLGMVVAGLFYQGTQGQSYRVANHFVSELGEVGVSRAAWAFNVGLIFGGAGVVVFAVGLTAYVESWLRVIVGALGITTGMFGALVGVFPMNNLPAHMFVANGFFYPGLVTMTFFSVYVLASPRRELPRWVAIPGLFAAGSLCAFLFLSETIDALVSARTGAADLPANFGAGRPDIWVMAFSEWIAIGAVLFWVAAVAAILLVRRGAAESAADTVR